MTEDEYKTFHDLSLFKDNGHTNKIGHAKLGWAYKIIPPFETKILP